MFLIYLCGAMYFAMAFSMWAIGFNPGFPKKTRVVLAITALLAAISLYSSALGEIK